MMSKLLERYLALEKEMMQADDAGNTQLADIIRCKLDPIWYQLTDAEHELLTARGVIK